MAEQLLRQLQVSGLRVYNAPRCVTEYVKTMTPFLARDTTAILCRIRGPKWLYLIKAIFDHPARLEL
jgi:hypothetical protein